MARELGKVRVNPPFRADHVGRFTAEDEERKHAHLVSAAGQIWK